LASEDVAFTVSVALPPPLAKLTEEDESEQVTPVPVQVKLTLPLKPFTADTLIGTVPLLPAVTGTIVVSGTSEKSASGLLIGLNVVDDGA
jgi:predicted Kef-type K+ transport protein